MTFDPEKAARFIMDAHARRAPYENLPADIAPATLAEAYAAQDALAALIGPREGGIAGHKIATTTKVMQDLMGIDHPCGGLIFAKRVHRGPTTLRLADYMNVVIECELALRLGSGLPVAAAPHSAASVAKVVDAAMPAFELIEDRKAHYKSCKALSLICDNCWNAGIVVGAPVLLKPGQRLTGIAGKLEIDGQARHAGATDDVFETLAWVANLAAQRGRALEAGMVVITGSVIPTLPIRAGERFVFSLEGLGTVEVRAV